jgi:hypothetical protein
LTIESWRRSGKVSFPHELEKRRKPDDSPVTVGADADNAEVPVLHKVGNDGPWFSGLQGRLEDAEEIASHVRRQFVGLEPNVLHGLGKVDYV